MTNWARSDRLRHTQNKNIREEWHARRSGRSIFFTSNRRQYDATGRRRGGGCWLCRLVSAASVAQGRLYRDRAGRSRRRRRHLVLEPLPWRTLRHPDHRLQLHLRSGAGDRVEMVGEIRHPAGNPALPRFRDRALWPAARHPLSHQGDGGELGSGHGALAACDLRWRDNILPLLHHGHRLPLRAKAAGDRWRQGLQG